MDSTCLMIRYQLWLYRAGKLPEAERAHVYEHLMSCPECAYLLVLAPEFGEV